MTTIDPSEKKYELDPFVTRVLKRGDLTRINSEKPGKLGDHHGDLARVVQAIPVGPTLENSHPFVYDLELVLGGKLHGIFRADLLYTTASQEGMTDDARARRKRKPNVQFDAEAETEESQKLKGAGGRKKKTSGKKGKVSTTSTPAVKTNASKKRPAIEMKGKTSSSKKNKPNSSDDNAVSSTVASNQAMDLYERHRKEFERSIGRLEKADAYNFFGTLVPPEFEEFYTKPRSEVMAISDSGDGSSHISQHPSAQHENITSESQTPIPDNLSGPKKMSMNSKKSNGANDSDDDDDQKVYFPSTPPFNFVVIRRRMELGRYILDRVSLENEQRVELLTPYWKSIGRKNINKRPKKSPIPILHPKGIDWDLFRKDIHAMCDAAVERNKHLDDTGPGTLAHAANKIKDLMEHIYEKNGRRHFLEMSAANDRHRFSLAMDLTTNTEAAVQGKWKRDAFPERKYERLRGDVVCAGLSQLDEKIAAYELKTTLEDKFIGLAYKYDDTGQSEGWMKSILDVAGEQSQRQKAALALAADDGAIKAQVAASMQSLLIGVLDKVMTETGVLEQKELRCANSEMDDIGISREKSPLEDSESRLGPEFVVHEVWGIDCYTRRNVAICLETEFDSDTVQSFTEKWLLPAINACPPDLAYEISNACRILEGMPFDESTSLDAENGTKYEQWKSSLLGKALLKKIAASGPVWLHGTAHLLRRARDNLGPDFFRIHPKGHGSIVLCEKLEPNRLVTFYRGEIYPSWRWGEKIDAIAKVQQQKGLKPVLPDFFNMALERPQHDPRGYGLLFVDASRKSNYGSMLSHSCQPSCEVHVVAVNGELRLAITTIREMTIGDELTFDYNAVTESLFEYQSAVCLCGHRRCSGSFLHFATADCYQQVLNRNSPVASRLANLIKGCTKKVMSEEDDKILKRHGFQTAAFGAVSVNRRNASALANLDSTLDSMDIVPVWLRTYVADTLRYIEYERRALPIALICNDLYDETGSAPPARNESDHETDDSPSEEEDNNDTPGDSEKSSKRSKPEPTFFYYARTQRDYFVSLLDDDEDKRSLAGAELKREVQKLASVHWKSLDDETKEYWKNMALADWEKTLGDKANIESEKKKTRPKVSKNDSKQCKIASKAGTSSSKPQISFQEADAEGVSAMEQRIQQLTQTLSRIGRVLDRHREATMRVRGDIDQVMSDEILREVTHAPLVIMQDEDIVAWMWKHSDGIVRTLLKHVETDICVSPELKESIFETVAKYDALEKFGDPGVKPLPESSSGMTPSEAREYLNEALLELRKKLLDGIQQMASTIKKQKAKSRSTARLKERDGLLLEGSRSDDHVRAHVKSVMEEMLSEIEQRFSDSSALLKESDNANDQPQDGDSMSAGAPVTDNPDPDADLEPWLRNFNKRFKLEKAADLLLLYAKTGHFFAVKSYEPLKSSPIEVYARDLGNAVPASTIDRELAKETESSMNSPPRSPNRDVEETDSVVSKSTDNEIQQPTKRAKKLCNPEDIISNVVIEYQGDYVLSQLLQWYNAGIGQKPGLPDMIGCVSLPSMKGCWTIDGTTVSNSHTDRATRYQSATRRSLIEWFKDPLKRGNPWPDDVRKAFVDKEENTVSNETSTLLPLGSPILDFLVTGDDTNLNSVMAILSSFHSSSARIEYSSGDGLFSTVDEGRPAEAVSNWVQCESPTCQKWRKVPWYIDIDMLPEKFYCKDVVWNPKAASCDAPEDEWDKTADAQVGADAGMTTLSLSTAKYRTGESNSSLKLGDFRLGAQFDVQRAGKQNWVVATVVKLDLTGDVKRVKVHYPKMQMKFDEWIEIDSPRIAKLYSKVQRPSKKEIPENVAQPTASKADRLAKLKERKRSNKPSVKQIISNEGDDEECEPAAKPHLFQTEDSSMADVFLQDSDDDSSSVVKENPKVVLRRPILNESEDDLDEHDAREEEEDNVLVDSDPEDPEEEKIADFPKTQSAQVTDESSPDAIYATKVPSKKSKGSSWTIPKKKIAPVKASLIPSVPPVEEHNPATNRPATTNAGNAPRIPRKKLGASSPESKSLLLTEPLVTSKSPQVPKEKTKTPGGDTMLPSESHVSAYVKPNTQRNTNLPVSQSNGHEMNRGERNTVSATARKDLSSTFVNGNHIDREKESRARHGGSERGKHVEEYARDRGHRMQNTLGPPVRSEPSSTNLQRQKSRDHWDVYRPEKPREGTHFRNSHDERPLYRDRHRGDERSDAYRRDGVGHETSRRNNDHDRPSGGQGQKPPWSNQAFSPTRHEVSGSSHFETKGYRSPRHPDSHSRDRYDAYVQEGSPIRRPERFHEFSKEHPGNNGPLWKRDQRSQDRFERESPRRNDNSPEYEGYNRHGGRPYRKNDDDYRYRSRHGDRHEEEENYRYHVSPRERHRSQESRDRSRDRTREISRSHGSYVDPPSDRGHRTREMITSHGGYIDPPSDPGRRTREISTSNGVYVDPPIDPDHRTREISTSHRGYVDPPIDPGRRTREIIASRRGYVDAPLDPGHLRRGISTSHGGGYVELPSDLGHRTRGISTSHGGYVDPPSDLGNRTRGISTSHGGYVDPPSNPGQLDSTTAKIQREVRYNSANFDEEEFLGGRRPSKSNRRDHAPQPMGESSPRPPARGYQVRMLEEYN